MRYLLWVPPYHVLQHHQLSCNEPVFLNFFSYSFLFIFWSAAILWTGKCSVVFTSWSTSRAISATQQIFFVHTYQIRSCIGRFVLIWNSKFDLLSLFSNGDPGLDSHHLFTWLNPIAYTNPSESLYLSLS